MEQPGSQAGSGCRSNCHHKKLSGFSVLADMPGDSLPRGGGGYPPDPPDPLDSKDEWRVSNKFRRA